MLKYEAKVISIGPLTSEFLDHNILVFFNESAPEELAEFAIIHDGKILHAPVAVGDQVVIGDVAFDVLAVGEVSNENLANLGHLVLKVNGEHEVEMPGDVCVDVKPLPVVTVGTTIRVEGKG